MKNILDYSVEELKIWLEERSESGFRAKQIFKWIYNGVWNFEDMNNIPLKLRQLLKENFYIDLPEIVEVQQSKSNDTKKVLYKFKDNNIIEAVIMKYSYGNSICVSTQVGCRMGCKFCASTINGLVRSLSPGEMLGEVIRAQFEFNERISNVVLMGSGEPFDNFENVMKFIELLNSKDGLNIGQRHITLSTCGIVPQIIKFADKNLQVTLAISLHAPDDVTRRSMMPISNKYSIREILEACSYYINKTNKRVTFEYALVSGVNDSTDFAESLASLLKGKLCHVNLIPVNEINENGFRKSEESRIERFKKILESNHIETTVRREMGSDIDAACGQLRRKYLES